MPSDFAEAGKRFETAIPVPEMPIASIRHRSQSENVRHRTSAIACAVAAIVALGGGTVLAAMKYGGVQLWLSGDKAAVVMRSFTNIYDPKAEDLRRVTATATFPVVLPAGIPKGMHLRMLLISPADHPSFIYVQYRNEKTGSSWGFSLFDSSHVNTGELPPMPNGEKPIFEPVAQWSVGRETVVAGDRGVVSHVAEIRDAMLRLTPAQSLAQTLPMLHRVTVLGGLDGIADAAEAIAPADGRSVLVDRGNLGQMAALAREHKALFSIRTSTVDNLPLVDGKPDFAHQSSHFSKELTLSAGGVRALAAVLATKVCGNNGRMGSGFTCEMLINERSGRAYRIWAIPLKLSTPSTKYIVDVATFRVVQER